MDKILSNLSKEKLISWVVIFLFFFYLFFPYPIDKVLRVDSDERKYSRENYQNIKFIEKELNSFKKENIKFVDHNIHLINVKSLKNAKKILAISILLGLIVGIFYVLISNAYQPKKISKKNN